MTFSEEKRVMLRPQKGKGLSTFLLALLTAASRHPLKIPIVFSLNFKLIVGHKRTKM